VLETSVIKVLILKILESLTGLLTKSEAVSDMMNMSFSMRQRLVMWAVQKA
jgi:hypothetical protein